jgi:hypothetical protein
MSRIKHKECFDAALHHTQRALWSCDPGTDDAGFTCGGGTNLSNSADTHGRSLVPSVVSATKRASLSICCAICAFLLASAKLRSETGIRRACQIGALQSASAPRGCRPLSQFCGSGSRRLIPRGSPAVLSNNCEHRSRVQLNCRLPFAGSFFSSIGVFVFFELATTVKKRAALAHHYLGWIQAVDQNGSSSPLPQCALALSNARCVTATGTRHHQK